MSFKQQLFVLKLGLKFNWSYPYHRDLPVESISVASGFRDSSGWNYVHVTPVATKLMGELDQ